jgi:hypothetical protein
MQPQHKCLWFGLSRMTDELKNPNPLPLLCRDPLVVRIQLVAEQQQNPEAGGHCTKHAITSLFEGTEAGDCRSRMESDAEFDPG